MPRSTPKTKRLAWIEPVLLGLFTAALWARSLAVPIHEWDDSVYLFRDSRLDHLTWENIGRILTQPFFANFHPITTLTYAFDRALWGAWTPGFHITQILFYVGGVLGLYFLFARLLNSRSAALAAAAIFAAHTIHVESVAWLASRKDVVCLFFYAPALLAYIRYAEDPSGRPRNYAVSLILGAAAMLSKGYAVILPAALLAYDYCFTGRITRRNLLDKVPFLLASAATILLTLNAQGQGGALVQSAMDTGRRVALLAKVFALYAGKALLPIDLSAFYTIAAEPIGSAPLFGFAIAAAMAAGFFLLRRRAPAAAFGIALYVLPLATVMNVFFRLQIWMADRYLFLPTVGSSLALVSIAALLARRRSEPARSRGRRPQRVALSALAAVAAVVVAVYSVLTFARIDLWTSRVRLWSDVVRKGMHLGGSGPVRADDLARVTNLRAAASTPIMSLARAYETGGEAEEGQRISALLNAASGGGGAEGPMTLAQQDLREGRPADAIRRLQPIAASGSWLSPLATMWMGVAQGRMGQRDVGRQTILQGVELYRKTGQPATDGLLSVGSMAFNREEYAEAETWYRLATEQSPREGNPKYYLARSLEAQGKLPEALALYKRIASGDVPIMTGSMFTLEDVYLQMGGVEQKLGNPKGAIACGEEVLRLSPNHPKKEEIRAWIEYLGNQAK